MRYSHSSFFVWCFVGRFRWRRDGAPYGRSIGSAMGIGGWAGEDTGPYGVGPPDMVRENVCRGAQCAPLQTVYRSIPIDEGWRAEAVAPYGDLYNNSIAGKYGGICRTGPAKQPSSSGGKSWRGWQSGSGGLPQSYRREDALKIPSTKQEQPPPRWGRQGWTSAGLSRGNASWGS